VRGEGERSLRPDSAPSPLWPTWKVLLVRPVLIKRRSPCKRYVPPRSRWSWLSLSSASGAGAARGSAQTREQHKTRPRAHDLGHRTKLATALLVLVAITPTPHPAHEFSAFFLLFVMYAYSWPGRRPPAQPAAAAHPCGGTRFMPFSRAVPGRGGAGLERLSETVCGSEMVADVDHPAFLHRPGFYYGALRFPADLFVPRVWR
jgi:hypothetical protein